mmetsp:Transcript_9690/g.22300  ORF Transcript_9690/g.22300 Transcript_9690/m.22300 type:complete len:438 (-) Transcript_9690:157-1470(-)
MNLSFFVCTCSLSSSPGQSTVTLHIRKAGWWTKSLFALAEKKDCVDIFFEGPYGSVGVDLQNKEKYKMVILFSGGIGVTPMQSICNQLMYEHHSGQRCLKNLSFVWIERDPQVFSEVDVVRRTNAAQHKDEEANGGGKDHDADEASFVSAMSGMAMTTGDIGTTLLANIPVSRVTDEQLHEEYHGDLANMDDTMQEDEASPPIVDSTYQFNTIRFSRREQTPVSEEFYPISENQRPGSAAFYPPMTGAPGRQVSGGSGPYPPVTDAPGRQISDGLPPVSENVHPASTSENSRPGTENLRPFSENLRPISENERPVSAELGAPTQVESGLPVVTLPKDDGTVLKKAYGAAMGPPLDLQVYLTSKNLPSRAAMPPFVVFGRPDVKKIFARVRAHAVSQGEKRVAVCVCAPMRLVTLCSRACAKYSDDKVVFDFHSEVFE